MIVNVESEREYEVIKQARWNMLRSDIYIRDKGICWICNSKVELNDYDLGHLIDRCNHGQDDYDNLAVMHKKCNISKPRHTTLEEAMKWKLTPRYLSERPMYRKVSENQLSLINQEIPNTNTHHTIPENKLIPLESRNKPYKHHKHHRYLNKDAEAIYQLVIEYFENRPELLTDGINFDRSEAIKQLASTLDINVRTVRNCLLESGLVKPKKVLANGSQYKYILDNLESLKIQYYSLDRLSIQERGKIMNLYPYQMLIFRYIIGEHIRISPRAEHGIKTQLAKVKAKADLYPTLAQNQANFKQGESRLVPDSSTKPS